MTPIEIREMATSAITIIVTLIFGELAKKFNWVESKYIPVQNLIIGVASGIGCYYFGVFDNLVLSIGTCLVSAWGAGGLYDTAKTKINN